MTPPSLVLPNVVLLIELRRRLNEHARALHLPAAALVTSHKTADDAECRDLLSVLTVLAKSSGHVYLRDKEANLAVLHPGRRVVLLVTDPAQPRSLFGRKGVHLADSSQAPSGKARS